MSIRLLQYTSCGTRTVHQSTQPVQFSQWQFGASLPQGIWAATTGPPQATLLAQNVNPIFIRGKHVLNASRCVITLFM